MINKKLSKFLCVLCTALITLSVAACGGGKTDSSTSSVGGDSSSKRENETKIVIYTGGSSEYSWAAGTEEEDVLNYIEEKYHAETGVWLDFKISHLGESMKTKLNSDLSAGAQVDIAISHTGGGAGIDNYFITQDLFYDLYDDLYDYGTNLLEYIKGNPLNRLTSVDNKVIGIPSAVNPYKFGILVRKDWMEACGYTDDPEKAQTQFKDGVNYTLIDNLEAFTDMCKAMKEKYNLSHVITGAPWDIEKVVLGAFGDTGYFSYGEHNGEILPGYLTDEYLDVLNLEYKWAKEGIISPESSTILLEQGEINFIGEKTGVFILDPTVQHLISVARKCKSSNPNAEFTVLGALTADETSEQKGFMNYGEAAFAACITKTSKNAVKIMKFLNWVYKSADNYNLCRYGIEGVHWVNNGDGTYSYPAGKEEYLVKAPYSGILTLVENQNISNLTYKGYSEEELKWIATSAEPSNYVVNDVVNYMWPTNAKITQAYSTAITGIYGRCAVPAWTGQTDPATTFDTERRVYLESGGREYVDFITEAYKIMKAARS